VSDKDSEKVHAGSLAGARVSANGRALVGNRQRVVRQPKGELLWETAKGWLHSQGGLLWETECRKLGGTRRLAVCAGRGGGGARRAVGLAGMLQASGADVRMRALTSNQLERWSYRVEMDHVPL